MKTLLPTLREKKRYVVYELKSTKPLSKGMCEHHITSSLHNLCGILGSAQAGLQFLPQWKSEHSSNAYSQKGIVRVSNKGFVFLKAALALLTDASIIISRSVCASGILQKVKPYCEG